MINGKIGCLKWKQLIRVFGEKGTMSKDTHQHWFIQGPLEKDLIHEPELFHSGDIFPVSKNKIKGLKEIVFVSTEAW